MSPYFGIGDETPWNPSHGAARRLLRQVEVFEGSPGRGGAGGSGRAEPGHGPPSTSAGHGPLSTRPAR
ncbi:hypothetical protein [Streptomyces sp. NPDC001761]